MNLPMYFGSFHFDGQRANCRTLPQIKDTWAKKGEHNSDLSRRPPQPADRMPNGGAGRKTGNT